MRALTLSLLLLVVMTAGAVGAQQTAGGQPNACVGTVGEPPESSTVVSIQGTRVTPGEVTKEQALLVSFAPDGTVEWVQNSSANGRWWAYDVDPLPDGNLLYSTTEPGISVVGEFDPNSGEYVWVERFDSAPDSERNPLVVDAHDADLVGDELLLVDKGRGHERLLAYNLTTDRVAWEWRFAGHPDAFPRSGGGPPDDWTHVNDVDRVSEDRYMISVRNFDQVAFVNRTTDEVDLTLGADGRHDILYEQHNPDYLRGPDGEHTVLVADSLNDRVVEYEYDAASDTWERVWAVGGFDEPRDADRLENGNTLVTDRKGHRVVEITPRGLAVWEVYTPYEPYDAERNEPGSNGPTMREQDVTGRFEVSNDAGFTTAEIERCAAGLFGFASDDSGLLGTSRTFFENNGSGLTAGADGASSSGDADPSSEASPSGDTDPSGESVLPTGATVVAGTVVAVLVLGLGLGYRRYG
jgi:hypothetical protein